jgi:YegS/Rv2252/BmrU family lipid kinase
MTTLLLVNSKAGDNARDGQFWLAHLRAAGVEPQGCFELQDANWREGLSRDHRLLVAGGDGSVSVVAQCCREIECVLGVLPSGTANDFARSLGISEDPYAACAVVAGDHVCRVDVGMANDRQFLNVAHVGLGAQVGKSVSSEHKRQWGPLSYLRTLVDRVAVHRGFHASIRCDERVVKGRWLEIAVANAPYFGGGHRIPAAELDDGQLDLVAIRPRPIFRLLWAWMAARITQRMPEDDAVIAVRATRIEIRSWRSLPVSADGEAFGRTPARLSISAAALRVIAPSN